MYNCATEHALVHMRNTFLCLMTKFWHNSPVANGMTLFTDSDTDLLTYWFKKKKKKKSETRMAASILKQDPNT